jgi:asparagine synthase (glutamine-hydrolysing)
MCGICGVVDLTGEPIDDGSAQAMRAVLAHRGPDEEGAFVKGYDNGPFVYLGQRRLRIIDLSPAASQPLANEDGTVLVTFNGEIYNFRELTKELKARGHVFVSKSDTEVIVHGYEEFGPDVVEKLDGMFAFALWDERRRRLLVARDRCGKKPLYYSFDGRRFSFASEIKGLLVCPWVSREIDEDRIPEYLAYGYVATPRTMFSAIRQLPPASYMEVGSDGPGEPQRYWKLEFSHGASDSPEEARTHVRSLLEDAVRKRLISDVPLGAFLSGGVDSSIVVGLMSKIAVEPVKTFTIGFSDDPSYDEREPAQVVARHFGTDHTEYVVRPSPVELVERLLWHHDQPYGDSSAIPTFMVSKLARADVTVALVGDGGDESFAGYDRFLAAMLADRVPGPLERVGRLASKALPRNSGYFSTRRRLERFTEGAGRPVEERYRGWIAMFSDEQLSEVVKPDLRAHMHDSELHGVFSAAFDRSAGKPLLHRLLELNFETYLPDDLLVKMDRMSMASSLETRSPLLDRALIEYTAKLPPHFKLKGMRLKRLLKETFADFLPKEILERPKHGFGVPMGAWFRGELAPMFRDVVVDSSARSHAYLDAGNVSALFDDHVSGAGEHGYRLWTLLNLELWLRRLDEPASSRAWGDAWQPDAETVR